MSFQMSIPVFVEKVRAEGEPPFYRVRPVFFDGFTRTDQREDRAVRHLREDLQKAAAEHAKAMRHDILAAWAFHPKMDHRRINLVLNLRKHTLRPNVFLIQFTSLGRTLVISPDVRDVCFELSASESLQARAAEVFTEHYRSLEKSGADLSEHFAEDVAYAHVETIELKVGTLQKLTKEQEGPGFALLGEQQEVSGSYELERTGRSLNRLYPHDLERASFRDDEVARVRQWFGDKAKASQAPPPLLLVGPNQVGKTAVIHEWVFRLHQERGEERVPQVWLLSPQRLISGMSYVGQWEQRVLAIFDEAQREGHILYFDDLIGLFSAGKSRDSNLTVGALLKLQLEEGRLRLVAEATPEVWRKLREVDRGLADLFTVLHVREPDSVDTLKILIRTLQDLELAHGCEFAPETLPLIMELCRRYVRTRAFPGKGAEMLRQLAATRPGQKIGKTEVYQFFESKTGVRQRFMDRGQSLPTEEVRQFFRNRIVGQDEALEAMIEGIVLAKAQLNDPNRPICSMLFLGPTGVGKTECAKSLAEYYFGSAERLLRFDMNEFSAWDAVPRLIGDFGGRQGVLTGAVRRRPHAVILLDEIEKANSDVFDLLLQVLDDGRLTDASGITTDFCNAVIILTSNLGAQEVKARMGFGAAMDEGTEVYIDAARKFFRPEFFNRLDRVIAFHELGKQHIEGIVHALVNRVLQRQGLHRRQMSISLDTSVYNMLSQVGFKREFGARALRRAVEDHLVEPLALELANITGRRPAFIRAAVVENKLELEVRGLTAVPMRVSPPSRVARGLAENWVRKSNVFVQRLDNQMEDWQAQGSDRDRASTLDHHYFLIREELMEVRKLRDRLHGLAENASHSGSGWAGGTKLHRGGRHPKQLHLVPPREGCEQEDLLSGLFQRADAGRWLDAKAEESLVLDDLSHTAHQLIAQAARAQYFCHPELADTDRVLLRFRMNGTENLKGEVEERFRLYQNWIETYSHFFQYSPGLSKRIIKYEKDGDRLDRGSDLGISDLLGSEGCFLYGEGPGFADLLAIEDGLELFCFSGQGFEYGRMEMMVLRPGETVVQACRRAIRQFSSSQGLGSNKVFRIRHERGWVLDLKSGILTQNPKISLWTFLMPLLERPVEFM